MTVLTADSGDGLLLLRHCWGACDHSLYKRIDMPAQRRPIL